MKVCFYFENKQADFWSGHRIDLENWLLPSKSCGVTELAIVNRSDFRFSYIPQTVKVSVFNHFEDFEKANPEPKLYIDFPKNTDSHICKVNILGSWLCFGPSGGWGKVKGRKIHLGIQEELYSWQSFIFMLGLIHGRSGICP